MQTNNASSFNITSIGITSLQEEIIKALLYFDIFDHPLREEEIESVIHIPAPGTLTILNALEDLVNSRLIDKRDGHYFIGDENGKIERRIHGGRTAENKLNTARKYTRLISHFPFVKAICISGSLSKGYMDKNSDIDYFVVTAPKRLWISRLSLTFFKKVFLFNSRKNFCINYFIDSDSLVIPDKNLFTATELAFIIPVYNYSLYESIMNGNSWKEKYYPNFPLRENRNVLDVKDKLFKRISEKVFTGKFGDFADNISFQFFNLFLKKKYKIHPDSKNEVNIRIRKNTSKHHPQGFQWKVLDKYNTKIREFEKAHGLTFNQATE